MTSSIPPNVTELRFADDGQTPNNPKYPLLLYRGAFKTAKDPARALEDAYRTNQWQGIWRWGVYSFHHYHSTAHEVLGVARGSALLQFGGESGEAVNVAVGDVIVLPAGTGHKCLRNSNDFMVVGAYPPGQSADLIRSGEGDITQARRRIRDVPVPANDPVFGDQGPMVARWRTSGNPAT